LLSLFYKIDRIHSFDIRHSIFCGSAVLCSTQAPAAKAVSGSAET